MDEWREITRTGDPIGLPPARKPAISALSFDVDHDLVWAGDENGRLFSLYGPELRKYTSFKAHSGPVKQLLSNERGIISVGDTIRMTNRRGMARWTINDDSVQDLQCMTYTGRGASEILVAGMQNDMLVVNIDRGTVIQKEPGPEQTAVMRRGRMICAGSSTGEVSLLDPKTFKVQHRFAAHTGTITDMDTQGNLLLTCGFSARHGQYVLDPIVKVFDLRTMRPLVPIPFPAGPTFIRMHPKLPSAIITAQMGQYHITDVNNVSDLKLRQATTVSFISAVDLSPSGDAFALADADGIVQLWGTSDEPSFSEFASPVDWPDPVVTPPKVEFKDDTPLNMIGMSYYREELLSSWPATMLFEVGNPSPQIDPEVLATMKTVDFVGYAPNPRRKLRNQVEKNPDIEKMRGANNRGPRFRSERDKLGLSAGPDGSVTFEDMEDDVLGPSNVPRYYRKVEIQYSKFGIEDFDFGFYNKTAFAGLETHIPNSYCNALLQMYHFIPHLRRMSLAHMSASCSRHKCMFCELGFLSNMLQDAKGQNCHASNFLRTLKSMKQASALGLLDGEDGIDGKIASRAPTIQSFNRFFLDQINMEGRETDQQPVTGDVQAAVTAKAATSIPADLMGMNITTLMRCTACASESVKPSTNMVFDLIYPKPHTNRREPPVPSFSSVLRASIHREGQTRAWCNNCRQYQLLGTRKLVRNLPPVLSLNAAVLTPDQWQCWASKSWPPPRIGLSLINNRVTCIHGRDLEKKTNDSRVHIYELTSIVTEIRADKNDTHLIALVKIPANDLSPEQTGNESPWYLFNDFLVKNVSEEEALGFPGAWKVPAVLCYQQVNVEEAITLNLPKPDMSILYQDYSIAAARDFRNFTAEILDPSELPGPDFVAAIDAEFVAMQQEETEVRSDGTKSTIRPSVLGLARVSVLRGKGEKEAVPFIDDYIATDEPVIDYLTEFSGIRQGDLDVGLSRHTLLPLKMAYKKLRLLVNLGCKFLGHGLAKDLRIINIIIPKEQIIDTVDLFYLKSRHRKLSLRFLAWYILHEEIQQDTHDSIEDARTALRLHQKYLEYEEAGVLETILHDLYNTGRKHNFRPPVKAEVEHAPPAIEAAFGGD
ncbi:hypothetical protein G7K_1204-t1 [Saitoella complicata NRRL Y-17804]|uniref:PAN2-PAN3 deadenylation complex catalytic subunit PAN2 n=1 Tax=Saitoella complicata (strain BCRC 22490 / CBS 7301 / JCM 7358 / NBRC 10748 / NRRL Y-17804) TaxID=698492 RepID=A0A0E9NC56_SAICN|nr:hypothetical protein G7K_1204-t1 [Saitoella complicata NRRL Y-17804]